MAFVPRLAMIGTLAGVSVLVPFARGGIEPGRQALAVAQIATTDTTSMSNATSSLPTPNATSTTTPTATSTPTTTATASTTTTTPPAVQAINDPSLAPVCGPVPGVVPGGAGCRIIAFYGTPLSTRMGVLGQTPKDQMLAALARTTQVWQAADPSTPTKCALELIAIVAQASPGKGKLHRTRTSVARIDEVLGWAREARCLLILDVQVGWSSVPDELPFLRRWLNEPDVHLALDPEWDMDPGVTPGSRIGRMSAEHIQFGIDYVAGIVRTNNLPPKLVIVHRFRDYMVQNPATIVPKPEVRLLVNADGFGPPASKMVTYRIAQASMPTTLTGFKLFFKNDKPMLQPADVLPLLPVPVFINYQ